MGDLRRHSRGWGTMFALHEGPKSDPHSLSQAWQRGETSGSINLIIRIFKQWTTRLSCWDKERVPIRGGLGFRGSHTACQTASRMRLKPRQGWASGGRDHSLTGLLTHTCMSLDLDLNLNLTSGLRRGSLGGSAGSLWISSQHGHNAYTIF